MRIPRKLAGLAAAGAATTLVLAACASDDGGDNGDDAAATGFEACLDDPNTCNSGETQPGGDIVWVTSDIGSGWNDSRSEANSVYSAQARQGILPEAQYGHPDGSHAWGELLAEPGELLGEDPFSWQYQIREDAVWSDGEPITADDFILGWKFLTSDEFGMCVGCDPAGTTRSEQVETVEGSEDGKTVTVTLAEGEVNAEWMFPAFDVWPAHIADDAGFNIDTPEGVGEASVWFNETMPTWSGGPWMITEGDMENQVIKEPNPMWYGEPVNLDQIIVRFITEESTWPQAIQNGEIHGASPAAAGWPEDVIRQLQDIENVNVGIAPGGGFEHMDINFENEQLAEAPLREAIFTAVNRDEMAQRLYGDLFPEIGTSDNYFFRSFQADWVDTVEGTGYGSGNLEDARSILEGAGYTGFGEGEGPLMLDGEQIGPFRIRATGTSVRQESLQLIQAQLGEIGIEMEIEVIEDLGQVLVDGDFDIIEFGWSGGPTTGSFPLQMLHSESGSNFGHYNNSQVDDLVTEAASAPDLGAVAESANAAAEIAIQDTYVLPLFETPNYIFSTNEYINIRDNVLSGFRGHYHSYSGWGLAAQ